MVFMQKKLMKDSINEVIDSGRCRCCRHFLNSLLCVGVSRLPSRGSSHFLARKPAGAITHEQPLLNTILIDSWHRFSGYPINSLCFTSNFNMVIYTKETNSMTLNYLGHQLGGPPRGFREQGDMTIYFL